MTGQTYDALMAGLLVKGGIVLDLDMPLSQRDVRIDGDRIVEVGSALASHGERSVDAQGMLVMPGLINGHTHSDQSLSGGLSPNLPLNLWLMWAVYGQSPLSANDLYTTAASAALEMVRTGCTSVLDHPWVAPEEFEERVEAIMQAYTDVGIRAALAPSVTDRDFYETLPTGLAIAVDRPAPLHRTSYGWEAIVGKLRAYVRQWLGRHPRLTPVLGPGAPQRCSRELLTEIGVLAREHGVGVHTHLLEVRSQALACREQYGRSVVDELRAADLLGPHMSFAHGIWLDAQERGAIAGSGSVIVHNPVSNLRCGSGILPLQHLLQLDTAVALGTDGAASNDSQNVFETMKFAGLVHTLYGHYTRWPSAEQIWRMCLHGGAAALRQPLGRVAAHWKADLALLRLDQHLAHDKEHLLRSLLFDERGQSVDTVIVGGEIVLREGVASGVAEPALRCRATMLRTRLSSEPDRRRQAFEAAASYLSAIEEAAAQQLPNLLPEDTQRLS